MKNKLILNSYDDLISFTHQAVIAHLHDIVNNNYYELEKLFWSMGLYDGTNFAVLLDKKYEIKIRI